MQTQYAVPGLMPPGSPKNDSRVKAASDGSLYLPVHSDDGLAPSPRITYKVALPSGCVIAQDESGSTLYQETCGGCRVHVVRIPAGILPVGLVTLHVKLEPVECPAMYDDYDVEVPASPHHVVAEHDKPKHTR